MNGLPYPADFWRGIPNKGYVSNGHVLPDAFQFDKEEREDGFRELSINWNDCEESLTIALNQKKDNGKKQFGGGVANLSLSLVELILSEYIKQGCFSYERREIDGNPYHGNLLVAASLEKPRRSLISNGLALAAGTNIVFQPTEE